MIRRRNRRSSQVLHNRDTLVNRPSNAMSVVGRKPVTTVRRPSQVCRRPSPVLDCQEPATAVAGRLRFSAQRKTELNYPSFSSVQFSVVHWALGYRFRKFFSTADEIHETVVVDNVTWNKADRITLQEASMQAGTAWLQHLLCRYISV